MDGCWAFWELGCVIDWEAWAALGSLLAVATALFVSFATARQMRDAKDHERRIILAQLYSEAKKILFTSEWCIQLSRQATAGEIPRTYDPPFTMALRDIRSLNTIVYDLHGHVVPQFERKVAGVLIYQYTVIKTHLNIMAQTLADSAGEPGARVFKRIEKHVFALQIASYNIVWDLADALGYDNIEDRDPGPESYTTWAADELDE